MIDCYNCKNYSASYDRCQIDRCNYPDDRILSKEEWTAAKDKLIDMKARAQRRIEENAEMFVDRYLVMQEAIQRTGRVSMRESQLLAMFICHANSDFKKVIIP